MGRPCRSIVMAIAVTMAIVIIGPFQHLQHSVPDFFGAGRALAQTAGFLATFDGQPSAPLAWRPADWDVQVHSRQEDTWKALEAMDAMHGPDCGPPPATHRVSAYADAVFVCRDHLMTSIHSVS